MKSKEYDMNFKINDDLLYEKLDKASFQRERNK